MTKRKKRVINKRTYYGDSKHVCNEWVSVEDRLPETDENVLVYDRGVLKMARCNKYSHGWWRDGIMEELDFVTYWQPLPEPPV